MLNSFYTLRSVSNEFANMKGSLPATVRFASGRAMNEPSLQRQRRAVPAKPQHLRVPPALKLSSRLVQDSESALFHREIDVVLRDGNQREKRYIRREGWWIPTCIQGAGKMPDLLINVPITPILQDLHSGLYTLQKLAKAKWSGPLYQLRLVRDPEADDPDKPLPFDRIRVKPHNMNLNQITDIPRTIAFLYCPEDAPVRVRIPIRHINEEKCPGLKEGGWLNEVTRGIDVCVAPFTKAPLFATADLGGMRVKDRRTVADLHFEGRGNGCRTITADDTIATVISKI